MALIGTRANNPFAPPPIYTTPPILPQQPVINGDLPPPSTAIRDIMPNERPAWSQGEPGLYKTGLAGAGQRFGDWLHAPGTAGALLRGAAASLNGESLGGAIQAGAGYMDQQKAAAAHAQQQQFQNGLEILRQQVAQQQADQTGQHYERGDTTDALRLAEANRAARAREGLDANGQRIQLYGIDTNAATAQRGQDVSVLNNNTDNATSQANNIRSTDASRYGTDGQAYVAGIKPAGIGSGYSQTVTTTPADSGGWFGKPTPKTVTTTRAPLAAAPASTAPTRPAPAGTAPRIASDADYARLPSGSTFIAPDGTTRRKP